MASEIKKGDSVFVARDITRREGPYARKGDGGTVVDIFRPQPVGMGEIKPWHAKVRMLDGTIKTFRLTSLEH